MLQFNATVLYMYCIQKWHQLNLQQCINLDYLDWSLHTAMHCVSVSILYVIFYLMSESMMLYFTLCGIRIHLKFYTIQVGHL